MSERDTSDEEIAQAVKDMRQLKAHGRLTLIFEEGRVPRMMYELIRLGKLRTVKS